MRSKNSDHEHENEREHGQGGMHKSIKITEEGSQLPSFFHQKFHQKQKRCRLRVGLVLIAFNCLNKEGSLLMIVKVVAVAINFTVFFLAVLVLQVWTFVFFAFFIYISHLFSFFFFGRPKKRKKNGGWGSLWLSISLCHYIFWPESDLFNQSLYIVKV